MSRIKSILLNASFFVNILLLFFLIFEEKLENIPVILQVIGRAHPMLLHFPIALLVILLLFEFVLPSKKNAHKHEGIDLLLAVTAITASLTAIAGLLLFHSGSYESGNTMNWHKWTGISIALIAWILPSLRANYRKPYMTILTGIVVVTIIAGHNGASITHGENFLTQPLDFLNKKELDLENAVVFNDIIQPILQEKCTGCHNPNKAKGELLLISEESIKKGGESGAIIFPGSVDSSLFYQVLLLPMDDDKHMPPEGKPQLDEEELKILHWWIASGADFKDKYAEANTPDSISSVIRMKFGPGSPLDKLDIDFANPDVIHSLNKTGRTVRQISATKPYIEVYLGNKKEFIREDLEDLKSIAAQIISIDLANSGISEEQMTIIKNFPHLQKIHLENTTITDASIKNLNGHKYLEYINISNTSLSETALDELSEIKSLKKVYFYGSDIPVKALEAFSKSAKLEQIGYTPDLSDSSFAAKLASPSVNVDSLLFTQFASVDMSYRLRGVNMHYTTDGTDPEMNDMIYSAPLRIDSTCVLKIRAIKEGWESSPVVTYTLLRSRYDFVSAVLMPEPDKRFPGRKDTTLIDINRGSLSHGDGNYIGYEGQHITITLDLGTERPVSGIALGYLMNHGGYLFSPGSIELRAGKEKNNHKLLAKTSLSDTAYLGGAHQRAAILSFQPQTLRYFTLKVNNPGPIPKWHPGKGSKSWVFLDEVVVY